MTLTQQQREERRSSLGSSDWAAILGIPGAFHTRLEVWQSKVGAVLDDDETYQQARGNALEPFVCRWFAKETGNHVIHGDPIPEEAVDKKLPDWWRCQIDAVALLDGRPIPVEAKTGRIFDKDKWGESGSDQVPMHYLVQVMAQIAYLNAPYGYAAVDLGGELFRWYRIPRDQAVIDLMLAEGAKFWQLVQDGTPPEPTTSSEANIVWANHEPGEYLVADGQIRALVRAINEHKAEEKAHAELREKMELELKKLTQDREGAKDQDGTVLYTWKTQESTRIDTTALKKAAPDIAAKFTKTTTTRVLRIKEPKEGS